MTERTARYDTQIIEEVIRTIRGQRVILDGDLARLYGVETRRLNEQVKRNAERFPIDFVFMLTREEVTTLKSQFATSSSGHGGKRKLPLAFSEHGAIMAANVVNSRQAIEMSVFVVRAFIKMREQLLNRAEFETRLVDMEKTLLSHDAALRDLYYRIRPLLLPLPEPPRKDIGFRVKGKRFRNEPRGGQETHAGKTRARTEKTAKKTSLGTQES